MKAHDPPAWQRWDPRDLQRFRWARMAAAEARAARQAGQGAIARAFEAVSAVATGLESVPRRQPR